MIRHERRTTLNEVEGGDYLEKLEHKKTFVFACEFDKAVNPAARKTATFFVIPGPRDCVAPFRLVMYECHLLQHYFAPRTHTRKH